MFNTIISKDYAKYIVQFVSEKRENQEYHLSIPIFDDAYQLCKIMLKRPDIYCAQTMANIHTIKFLYGLQNFAHFNVKYTEMNSKKILKKMQLVKKDINNINKYLELKKQGLENYSKSQNPRKFYNTSDIVKITKNRNKHAIDRISSYFSPTGTDIFIQNMVQSVDRENIADDADFVLKILLEKKLKYMLKDYSEELDFMQQSKNEHLLIKKQKPALEIFLNS